MLNKYEKIQTKKQVGQRFIVFQIQDKDMKLINSQASSVNNKLMLIFCDKTNTWKLADEMDNPMIRLFRSIKRLIQTEKRFEGTATTLIQKLTAIDSSLNIAPNALTRIFNRHSISMECEYAILYQQKKRTSEAREIILSLRKTTSFQPV